MKHLTNRELPNQRSKKPCQGKWHLHWDLRKWVESRADDLPQQTKGMNAWQWVERKAGQPHWMAQYAKPQAHSVWHLENIIMPASPILLLVGGGQAQAETLQSQACSHQQTTVPRVLASGTWNPFSSPWTLHGHLNHWFLSFLWVCLNLF